MFRLPSLERKPFGGVGVGGSVRSCVLPFRKFCHLLTTVLKFQHSLYSGYSENIVFMKIYFFLLVLYSFGKRNWRRGAYMASVFSATQRCQ